MPAFLKSYGIILALSAYAFTMTTFYINAKSDIKAEIERCNTEKVQAVQDATELLRQAEIANYTARIAELEAIAVSESQARLIAQEAAVEAQNRSQRVKTVIKEVAANGDSCLNQPVPGPILDSLR